MDSRLAISSWRWQTKVSAFLMMAMLLTSPLFFWPEESSTPPTAELTLLQPAPVPVLTAIEASSSGQREVPLTQITQTSDQLLNTLTASSVYVSDEASGAILLSKNPDTRLYPASTTKIMTALVAREAYYLNQVMTVKEEALTQGNTMGLLPNEQISVNQLLQGLLIASGNDAAFVLANNYPEGYQGFVAAMNQKASELGLSHSYFTNPSGLDAPQHQMTARDLTILAREVFKDEYLAEIMDTTTLTVTNTTGQFSHPLSHTHELLYTDQTAIGGKTGTTEGAGQVLVTKFRRPDVSGQEREILVAVMGSLDRYGDTRKIIDWVMANYTWQDFPL